MYEAVLPPGRRALRGTGGDAGEAVIMPKFHLKRLSRDRRETSSKNRKSKSKRMEMRDRKKRKTEKTTDFHQNRLSNQMGPEQTKQRSKTEKKRQKNRFFMKAKLQRVSSE